MSTKRNLRPRAASQYASQQEWNLDEEDVLSVRRFNAQEKFKEDKFNYDHGLVKEMNGEEFTLSYIQEHGLTQPLVFRDAKGLGMKMPLSDFTVQDVKRLVGPRRVVDVMDTRTQEASTMTLNQWAKYYNTKPRQKLLNVISLEFSCTKLDPLVKPPAVVSQLDWVELMWPTELKNSQTDPTNDLRRMMYPKVQKYCLMSVGGCYTDFHLDFGGTSVWYHVLKGEKLFLLIPPSPETHDMFQTWHMSGEQEGIFFAELVSKAQLVKLQPGDTFIMPSGWIHAVYTPVDSLVFGGNFLHSFNIAQQLRVAAIENTTKVPSKFRYPFYGTMHWYVVERYHSQLTKLGRVEEKSSSPLVSFEQGVEEEEDSKPLSSATINGKWLKGVTLKKVQVSAMRCSSESPLEVKPFLSVYERDGLLDLIQQMLNGNLFFPDVPPTYPSPKEILEELKDLLQCSSVERSCAERPTGIPLVPALFDSSVSRDRSNTIPRKRKRKLDGKSQGVKAQKKEAAPTNKRKARSKMKRKSLVVSVPKSVMTPATEDREEEEIRNSSVCEVADTAEDDQALKTEEAHLLEVAGPGSERLAASSSEEATHGSSYAPVPVSRLLTPPLSLSSTSSPSMSPSHPSPPPSPSTPSSQSFTLVLEQESPLPSSQTVTFQPLLHLTPSNNYSTETLEDLNVSGSPVLPVSLGGQDQSVITQLSTT